MCWQDTTGTSKNFIRNNFRFIEKLPCSTRLVFFKVNILCSNRTVTKSRGLMVIKHQQLIYTPHKIVGSPVMFFFFFSDPGFSTGPHAGLPLGPFLCSHDLDTLFKKIFIVLLFICAYKAWAISPRWHTFFFFLDFKKFCFIFVWVTYFKVYYFNS
jgi:hypothetical protein